MTNLPTTLIGEFIDAAVRDHKRASQLLSAHPDLISARWIHGETALHFLAVEGFLDGVNFLAERGADVNAVNEFGDAPLIDVAVLGYTSIADVLVCHGANPNARSVTRDNALHCAARSGNEDMVALLLRAGADARYRTELGESVFDAIPTSGAKRERLLTLFAQHGVTGNAN